MAYDGREIVCQCKGGKRIVADGKGRDETEVPILLLGGQVREELDRSRMQAD